MAPKVRRLAIMGKPSVAQLQQGAVHVRESKLRKALEKDEAKGWISIKKKMKKKKEDKKKVDKEKEVLIFTLLSGPPFFSFLLLRYQRRLRRKRIPRVS